MVCKVLSCLCGERYIPQRYIGTFLTMLIFSACLCMRFCTSVAIRYMVKKSTNNISDTTNGSKCSPHKEITANQIQFGENDWSVSVQSWILNSFFVGYLLMHIPSGYLSDKYGPRWVLISCVLVSIICTALIPTSADKLGYIAVIAFQILLGIGQGGILTGNTSWLTRWIPLHERGFLGSVSFTATSVGPLLATLLTNALLQSTDDWRNIYYFWAAISTFVCFATMLYIYSDVDTHLHATKSETEYLNHYLVKQHQKSWPYSSILSDYAVIAIIIAQAGHDFMMFFMYNNTPKFMYKVLSFHTENNAFVTSLPHLSMMVSTILTGILADWGISTKGWDVGFVRKLYTVIANMGSSILMVAVGYVGCNDIAALSLYTMSLCFKGLFFSGLKINCLDITTQYGGTIMALANGIGCISGFIGLYIISSVAADNKLAQWKTGFWIKSAVIGASTILYVFWGSGQRRRWDYPEEDWQFFEGSGRKWRIFDGVDKDSLAIQRGRAYLHNPKIESE